MSPIIEIYSVVDPIDKMTAVFVQKRYYVNAAFLQMTVRING